jgi:hypothetical protein
MSDAAGNISKATSTAQRTVMIGRWPPNNSEEGKKQQVGKNIDSSHFKSDQREVQAGREISNIKLNLKKFSHLISKQETRNRKHQRYQCVNFTK